MPMFRELAPGLFQWTSTCHSYVVKDGDHGLLIDLGDGAVLDHLGEIGVTTLDWVLFTHHHREQCQGGAKLAKVDVQTACGANEKQFFENPGQYRRMRPKLGDPFTVHGTSYVRPPVTPIRIDRTFTKMDTFEWRGREFWCIETPGDAPGHMTYCFRHDGDWRAFSGDLICDEAKLHTWFDAWLLRAHSV